MKPGRGGWRGEAVRPMDAYGATARADEPEAGGIPLTLCAHTGMPALPSCLTVGIRCRTVGASSGIRGPTVTQWQSPPPTSANALPCISGTKGGSGGQASLLVLSVPSASDTELLEISEVASRWQVSSCAECSP